MVARQRLLMRHAFLMMTFTVLLQLVLLFATVHSQNGYFQLSTYVFNVFPDANFSAFVLFEHDRLSRLQYSEYRCINASFEAHSDFIIQFRQLYTDLVRSDFTDFGFMESELTPNKEIVMLISRHPTEPKRPKHYLLTFDDKTIDWDSSKLYLYNALRNTKAPDKGLYFYGLYYRKNTDGSESESITQLAVNLPRNSGIDISVQPRTHMTIKGYFSPVNSVLSFKNTPPIVQFNNYVAGSEKQRRYLIAFGDFKEYNSTDITRPQMVQLNTPSASTTTRPLLISNTIIFSVMSVVITMIITL